MIHVLGFDATRYGTFLDPSTGNVYASTVAVIEAGVHADRTTVVGNTYKITTPHVVSWARDFFDCVSITGMLLEN